ncbi:hypothetical protein AMJ85_06180 [candidate division BRC1 bacterium SM23_51]|nr:MAG: hypothetical protein AMJ85_06180 [candidate division BRC1 bacterium SM23_51]
MIADQLRETIVNRIRAACDPDRIILFGSHARGEGGADSDIDLMVVKSGVEQRRREAVRIYRALKGLCLPIDVLVATPEIIERYKDRWCTVYHDVAREGTVIYDKLR